MVMLVFLLSCKPKNIERDFKNEVGGSDSVDVNDVMVLWPLITEQDAVFEVRKQAVGSSAHLNPISWLSFLGNSIDRAMIPLTNMDFNDLPNNKKKGLIFERHFKQVFCAAIKENTKNATKGQLPIGIQVNSYLAGESATQLRSRNIPIGDPLKSYCGEYSLSDSSTMIPDLTSPMVSFSPVMRSSIWRVVSARFSLCVGATKKLKDLMKSTRKIKYGENLKLLPWDLTSNCKLGIGIVAQPLDFPTIFHPRGRGHRAFDFAMHLNYHLPFSKIHKFIQAIVDIRGASHELGGETKGVPQYIHPGFGVQKVDVSPDEDFKQDNRNKFSKEEIKRVLKFGKFVSEKILSLASIRYLHGIEFFGTHEDLVNEGIGASWFFSSFGYDRKKDHFEQKKLNFVEERGKSMNYIARYLDPKSIVVPPQSKPFLKQDSIMPMMNISMAREFLLDQESLEIALQNGANLESAFHHNIFGHTCIDCHAVQAHRSIVLERARYLKTESFGLKDNGYLPQTKVFDVPGVTLERDFRNFADGVFMTPSGTEDRYVNSRLNGIVPSPPKWVELHKPEWLEYHKNEYLLPTDRTNPDLIETNPIFRKDYVLRNNGYFQNVPMISQRAINQSGLDAALTNRRIDLNTYKVSSKPRDVELLGMELIEKRTIQSFFHCLLSLYHLRAEQKKPIVLSVSFLEKLRSGDFNLRKYTGFDDYKDCGYSGSDINLEKAKQALQSAVFAKQPPAYTRSLFPKEGL